MMQECAKCTTGKHDFVNFCKATSQQKDTVCEVEYTAFEHDGHQLGFRIRANRFVHHMVRRLVGTMVQIGKGKRTVSQFKEMIDQPECNYTAHGIAAKGLILEEVYY